MAKLNLSQAAKVTGKNRTTIWRHINSGKLSAERDRDGQPFVDTSELIRVYGELEAVATRYNEKMPHEATPSYEELIKVVGLLRKEQAKMREQITNLTNRLSYIPTVSGTVESPVKDEVIVYNNKNPENDPCWPKEIKTMADIMLRNEIKEKYSK